MKKSFYGFIEKLNFNATWVKVFLLTVVFLTAAAPRSVELLNKNYLFGFDQGRDYLAVKKIVIDHKVTLIGSEIGAGVAGFKGVFHGPLYYYSLAIPFFIFQGDPYGGMVLMFLFSMASVVSGYIIGKRIFGVIGGFYISLLIGISPPLISQARFIWNSHPTTLFILLEFYFVYKLQEFKKKFFFLASFFSGFIYNYELAIAVPMSVTLLVYSFFLLRFKKIKLYIYLLLGYIVSLSPMIFFEIRHEFMALNGFGEYFTEKHTAVTSKFIQLLARDHFGVFLYNFQDTFPQQKIIPSLLFLLVFIFVVAIFIYNEERQKTKKFLGYLVLLLPVNFLVFMLLKNNVYIYYLVDLNLVYIFLFGYILSANTNSRISVFKYIFVGGLFLFLVNFFINSYKMILYDYKDYGGDAKIQGKIDALDYIYKDTKDRNFNLLSFTPPIYTYAYDYLIWWYGSKKYGYIPGTEKKGELYLLIEQDHSKPHSYKGWLETVIKDGKVIYTKKLPSGFIIQKRLI